MSGLGLESRSALGSGLGIGSRVRISSVDQGRLSGRGWVSALGFGSDIECRSRSGLDLVGSQGQVSRSSQVWVSIRVSGSSQGQFSILGLKLGLGPSRLGIRSWVGVEVTSRVVVGVGFQSGLGLESGLRSRSGSSLIIRYRVRVGS